MIKVLFFAQLSDLAGTDQVKVDYTAGLTPRSLVQELPGSLGQELIDVLLEESSMVSADAQMIDWQTELKDGVEIAFLPPFSGG